MTLEAFLFQALNGLASASGLFFVGAGLSLIFGVSRIINIAHGSLYMLGIYIAYSIATKVGGDRKSTRLNSSHLVISYAVFCLKKKKKKKYLHNKGTMRQRTIKRRHNNTKT